MPRMLKTREPIGSTVDKKIHEDLILHSKKTYIPMSKILDNAIILYLDVASGKKIITENNSLKDPGILKTRKPIGSTVDKNVYEELKLHSKKTSIPISKILDIAIILYLDMVSGKIVVIDNNSLKDPE